MNFNQIVPPVKFRQHFALLVLTERSWHTVFQKPAPKFCYFLIRILEALTLDVVYSTEKDLGTLLLEVFNILRPIYSKHPITTSVHNILKCPHEIIVLCVFFFYMNQLDCKPNLCISQCVNVY